MGLAWKMFAVPPSKADPPIEKQIEAALKFLAKPGLTKSGFFSDEIKDRLIDAIKTVSQSEVFSSVSLLLAIMAAHTQDLKDYIPFLPCLLKGDAAARQISCFRSTQKMVEELHDAIASGLSKLLEKDDAGILAAEMSVPQRSALELRTLVQAATLGGARNTIEPMTKLYEGLYETTRLWIFAGVRKGKKEYRDIRIVGEHLLNLIDIIEEEDGRISLAQQKEPPGDDGEIRRAVQKKTGMGDREFKYALRLIEDLGGRTMMDAIVEILTKEEADLRAAVDVANSQWGFLDEKRLSRVFPQPRHPRLPGEVRSHPVEDESGS